MRLPSLSCLITPPSASASRPRLAGAAHRPRGDARVGPERELALEQVVDALRVDDQEHQIGGLSPDLQDEARQESPKPAGRRPEVS
jgi:hypothetical protein